VTHLSDLEHLVSLADMMGGHVKVRRAAREWRVCAVSDTHYDPNAYLGATLASATAPTITGAVLLCLKKLRAKETDHAE
jgi:hypothetical protein